MIASGSEDGTAVIWDLNRAAYVRKISHHFDEDLNGVKVHLVTINESTVSITQRRNAYSISFSIDRVTSRRVRNNGYVSIQLTHV